LHPANFVPQGATLLSYRFGCWFHPVVDPN